MESDSSENSNTKPCVNRSKVLFICGLFNCAPNSKNCVAASNDRMVN